ncbi:MAG: dienelactone hydrolase family protein [Bacteroidales bacterium]|nr:dienelactone hydrolase family protein [Bacteroidales bacterium]
MRKSLFSALMVLNLMVLQAQHSELFRAEVFVSGEGTLPYRIMLPENFDPQAKYPLVFFLHGAGERGNDNEKQLVHGASFFASAENRTNFPAIVVFPQCAENDFWAKVSFAMDDEGNRSFSFDPSGEPAPSMKLAIKLLESMLKNDWIDKDRVYVGGLSMGGMGTFELLYRMPEVFAAAFPICGGGNPEVINPQVSQVNVWAFHGDADPVVPVSLSQDMVEAYQNAGVDVKLTLYPGVGHNAWDYVFQEPELLPWLFSNKK